MSDILCLLAEQLISTSKNNQIMHIAGLDINEISSTELDTHTLHDMRLASEIFWKSNYYPTQTEIISIIKELLHINANTNKDAVSEFWSAIIVQEDNHYAIYGYTD